ncbi:hypothetical protein QYE76_062421 [Lolium multiflorum]|uniref:RRM domain-containing protein n=1 Tax=Lolium multiflorum TaxID=4521 RepID=A0AAD8S2N4_LOLMU|nr:hypothetical protein QYE76_062421 [Lolium multiflorum]
MPRSSGWSGQGAWLSSPCDARAGSAVTHDIGGRRCWVPGRCVWALSGSLVASTGSLSECQLSEEDMNRLLKGDQSSRSAKPPQEPPNNILFSQNCPDQTSSMMVEVLFQQCPGFRKVRMMEARPGIALVEFHQSMIAMQALQGFRISLENPITISYAKK